jgi:hypothetical protein
MGHKPQALTATSGHSRALNHGRPAQDRKGCPYIKRLGQVDQDALRDLIDRSARVRKGTGRASS